MKLPGLNEKEYIIFKFDLKYRQTGIQNLCGIDEAGRGPLAGPVVAAALILNPDAEIAGLNDSKKLSESVREQLWDVITESAISYGIGVVEPEAIEQINILQATFSAMQKAVSNLTVRPDYILVDGRDFPGFFFGSDQTVIRGEAIIKGDMLSAGIAGASILAKVFRDRLMKEYAKKFPQYGFEQHKGYGTVMHRENIRKYGACPIHRQKFLRKMYASAEPEASLLS